MEPAGSRRPTIRDVAQHAGVSKSLVSLVLSQPQRVGEERRARVEASIAALGYRANLAARSLVARNRNTVGMVLGELHNPWVVDLAEIARGELQAAGFGVLFSAMGQHGGQGVDATALQTLRDLRVSGALVIGTADDTVSFAPALDGIPAVFVGSGVPPAPGLDVVGGDDAAGIDLLVTHLLESGHRRIAHLTGGPGVVSALREAAYHRSMKRHGLAAWVVDAGPSFEEGRQAVATQLLSRPAETRPDALCCFNDLSALGAMQALDAAGASMAVSGYDNIPVAAMGRISLTSVDSDNLAMGRQAARLLLRALAPGGTSASGRQVLVRPRLVVRSSTASQR